MRISRLLIVLAAALALLFAAMQSAAAQDGRWLRAESPSFIVYSEGDERGLRESIERLEMFDRLLRALMRSAAEPSAARLELYLFRDRAGLVEIWPGMITRVYHSSRLRAYHVTIITTVQKYRIRIPKADAYRFVQALMGVVPSESVHRLSPGLEALSWVPGISAVAELPGVERMLSRATTITAAQPARNELQHLQETVEQLQSDLEKLTEQVAFLEQLLARRAEDQLLTETTAES